MAPTRLGIGYPIGHSFEDCWEEFSTSNQQSSQEFTIICFPLNLWKSLPIPSLRVLSCFAFQRKPLFLFSMAERVSTRESWGVTNLARRRKPPLTLRRETCTMDPSA